MRSRLRIPRVPWLLDDRMTAPDRVAERLDGVECLGDDLVEQMKFSPTDEDTIRRR
jgi:hypothetical protein